MLIRALAVVVALAIPLSARAQTRPSSTAGMSAAEARIARADYAALATRFTLREQTIRAIARSIGARNPYLSDAMLLDAVAALSGDAAKLRGRVGDLEKLVATVADPSLRDPALAALRRANLAIDEGRLEDAERDFGTVRALRWDESEKAQTAWLEAIGAEATTARLRGDGDRAESLLTTASDAVYRRGALQAWQLDMDAADGRYQTGQILGDRVALDRAIALYRDRALIKIAKDTFPAEWAGTKNNLGLVLRTRGEWAGGAAGAAFLYAAVAAYRDALSVNTREVTPSAWAMTQINFANALVTQGERATGATSVTLLADAVAAYRQALTVYTHVAMPTEWAITHLNLGNALATQGERTEGLGGLAVLNDAVAAYHETLGIFTLDTRPGVWALAENNLGAAMFTLGVKTSGPAGLPLLDDAIAAYRSALVVRTLEAMPADWASTQNNLGTALATRGERTGGAAGLALLADAVAAFQGSLAVHNRKAMPADWAITNANLALAYEASAAIRGDAVADLRAAEAAVTEALTVLTPEHMPFYFEKATACLVRVRAKIAAATR